MGGYGSLGVGMFLPGSFFPSVATNATQSPWLTKPWSRQPPW